jgi:hypothetical protein
MIAFAVVVFCLVCVVPLGGLLYLNWLSERTGSGVE